MLPMALQSLTMLIGSTRSGTVTAPNGVSGSAALVYSYMAPLPPLPPPPLSAPPTPSTSAPSTSVPSSSIVMTAQEPNSLPKDLVSNPVSSDGEVLVQAVVVRRDLLKTMEWPVGSVIAQACHACIAVVWENREDPDVAAYLASGNIDSMHKVIKECKGELQVRETPHMPSNHTLCIMPNPGCQCHSHT